MSKQIQETVRVMLRRDGAEPATFIWNGRRYRVQRVEAVWKEMGAWWDGAGEQTFFRLTATGRSPTGKEQTGIYELCLDEPSATWTLSHLID